MFGHVTVLLQEAVEGLNIKEDGIYVDCTLGGAGHSSLILSKLGVKGRLIAFDQDDTAITNALNILNHDERLTIIKSNFRYIKEELLARDIPKVDGILFDLGVSSPQLDTPERGFSYHNDARLDMRMDQESKMSAYEFVNNEKYETLVRAFFTYGEEKFSKQIARKIESAREIKPIETTLELVEIIKSAIPAAARREGGHPAKRIFQAIRIAVNDELGAFEDALEDSVEMLNPGGRISVITFHSLEDRICKQYFKEMSSTKDIPRGLPILPEEFNHKLKVITRKPILPSEAEIETNGRSRSAKLRVAERTNK